MRRAAFAADAPNAAESMTPTVRATLASATQKFQHVPWNGVGSAIGAVDGNAQSASRLQLEQLKGTVDEVQKSVLSNAQQILQLRQSQAGLEREFPDILRQLDMLAGQLEREKGDVAILKEQLTFLAAGGDRRGTRSSTQARASGNDSTASLLRSLLFAIARYLYNPLLSFINGVYVILSPIFITFRCLSMFRSQDSDLSHNTSTTQRGAGEATFASMMAPSVVPSSQRSSTVSGITVATQKVAYHGGVPTAIAGGSDVLSMLRRTALMETGNR